MSQAAEILKHLQEGHTLTQLEAAEMFRCWRLSGRILDLRAAGYDVQTSMIDLPNGKRIARYSLPARLHQGELTLS